MLPMASAFVLSGISGVARFAYAGAAKSANTIRAVSTPQAQVHVRRRTEFTGGRDSTGDPGRAGSSQDSLPVLVRRRVGGRRTRRSGRPFGGRRLALAER